MTTEANITPERIQELADSVRVKMRRSLKDIDAINMQVRMLSFNAQVEAARAGAAGKTFGVVASSMGDLSRRTSEVAENLSSQVQGDIDEMAIISRQLATDVRGSRLSDLALNSIDLIDRNLYERSCDVRWWATDNSLTDACENPDDEAFLHHASDRMGVILNAYTVYFDLVLCAPDGRVLANGRPREYKSTGQSVANRAWFKTAMATRSGDEFGFETVHPSPLVNQQRILAYSCTVRKGGEATGSVVGVLGILFRWDALAQTVVNNTPVPEVEKPRTRAMIVDGNGTILADTENQMLKAPLNFERMPSLFDVKKGFITVDFNGAPSIIAHALSPGFETYATGWHSVIIQQLVSHNAG